MKSFKQRAIRFSSEGPFTFRINIRLYLRGISSDFITIVIQLQISFKIAILMFHYEANEDSFNRSMAFGFSVPNQFSGSKFSKFLPNTIIETECVKTTDA